MGRKNFYKWVVSVCAGLLVLGPLVSSAHFAGGDKVGHKEEALKFLERICEIRVKINQKYPKFRVPKICKTKEVKPPTLELYAEPEEIIEGESAVLSWVSENTLECNFTEGLMKEVDTSGTEVVSPLVTTAYTLTCDGVNGEGVERSVEVVVNPKPELKAEVIINEIAWMGSMVDGIANANAEWIELYNAGNIEADLVDWVLVADDSTPSISITSSCVNTKIQAGEYFLLVRTNDNVLGVSADCKYTGAMGNDGEALVLKNSDTEIIDTVNGIPNWEIGGAPQKGNNTTKETAQRAEDGEWFTNAPTPRSANSI